MHYKCWYTGSILQNAWWRLHKVEKCCLKCNYIIELLCSTGICTLYEVHVTLSLQRLILQQKHKARGATKLQKLHNSNVPLQFFFLLEILYYLSISLSNSFPLYVFSFHQFYFCPFAVWFPFAVGQPDIPWVLRFSRVSMMLTCWFCIKSPSYFCLSDHKVSWEQFHTVTSTMVQSKKKLSSVSSHISHSVPIFDSILHTSREKKMRKTRGMTLQTPAVHFWYIS